MNKLQKLYDLDKDIDLLEVYGKFKSASILHDKFVRTAQEFDSAKITTMLDQYKDMPANILDSKGTYVSPDTKAYDDNNNLVPFFNDDDFEILLTKGKLEKNNETYTYDNKKPLNSTPPVASPPVASPPVASPPVAATMTSTAPTVAPLLRLSDFDNEGQLYNAALNKIKEEFLKFNGDRDLGEKVYTDTIVQFSSSKVKRQFANQVQNLRTKAFRRTNQQWNQER